MQKETPRHRVTTGRLSTWREQKCRSESTASVILFIHLPGERAVHAVTSAKQHDLEMIATSGHPAAEAAGNISTQLVVGLGKTRLNVGNLRRIQVISSESTFDKPSLVIRKIEQSALVNSHLLLHFPYKCRTRSENDILKINFVNPYSLIRQ